MAVPSRRPALLCHAGGCISLPATTARLSARPGRDPGAPAAGLALRLPCCAVLPARPRQGLRSGLAQPRRCVFWLLLGWSCWRGNPVRVSAVGFCRRRPGRAPSGMHVLSSLLHYFVAMLYKSCITWQYRHIFMQDVGQLAHCPARGSRRPTPPLPWRASPSGPVLGKIPPRPPPEHKR